MAYSLSTSQVASITRERDALQETLDTYDSQDFMDALNSSIDEAKNVDNAVLNVWVSAAGSSDGVDPVEVVLQQLDGQTVTNPIPVSEMSTDSGGPLFLMGTIQFVVGQIQDLATTEPFKIGNSARIRLNANRYYPDVDAKDDRPSSDSRNVFDDHPWEAWEGNEGTELDYTGLRTIYQDGIYGTARGTPGTTSENSSGQTVDNPATEGTAQTSIDDGGQACIIGDNERFFIAMDNYLSSGHSTGSIDGANTVSGVNNLSVQGTTIAGTCSLSSTAMGSGTTEPSTYSPSVGDILSLNGGIIYVASITSGGSPSCVFTPPAMGSSGSGSTTCTTDTGIRYIILTRTNPSNGGFTNASQGAQGTTGTKREDYLGLKRFTIAISKTPLLIDTPAINTQGEVTTERTSLITSLGTAQSGLYATKYNIANTRCNWNNGTVSSLIAREFSRNNLFSPENQSITNPDFINEYVRIRNKIAEFQAILDGAS